MQIRKPWDRTLNKKIYEKHTSRSLDRAQNLKRVKRGQKYAMLMIWSWHIQIKHYLITSYLLFKYKTTQSQKTNNHVGEWEHIVISYIKQVIPPSIQETWHNWRSSMKKGEEQPEGGDAAGWGVEEADARNKKEASMLSLSAPPPTPFKPISFQMTILLPQKRADKE